MDLCFSHGSVNNVCIVQFTKLSSFDFFKQCFLNHYFICNLLYISNWPGDILSQHQLHKSCFKSQFSFIHMKVKGFFYVFLITFFSTLVPTQILAKVHNFGLKEE